MAVNNTNTDTQSIDNNFIDTDTLEVPKSFLAKLSPNQRKLVEALAANHKHGLLSSELTLAIGVSNKSDLIHYRLRMLLASEGLEIVIERVSRQWLWKLRQIQSLEVVE